MIPVPDHAGSEDGGHAGFTVFVAFVCLVWYFAILLHVFVGVFVV